MPCLLVAAVRDHVMAVRAPHDEGANEARESAS